MFGACILKMRKEYRAVHTDGSAISMSKDVVVRSPDEDIVDEGLIVTWQGIAIVV